MRGERESEWQEENVARLLRSSLGIACRPAAAASARVRRDLLARAQQARRGAFPDWALGALSAGVVVLAVALVVSMTGRAAWPDLTRVAAASLVGINTLALPVAAIVIVRRHYA
jgi:hypothetical protein